MQKIRECPHCAFPGAVLITIPGRDGFRDRYAVRCPYDDGGCGAEGGWRHYKEEAIEAWNERRRVYREP